MSKTRKNRLMAYIYMPLVFTVIGYLTIYMVASPVVSPLVSAINMILRNQAPSFNQEGFTSIFDTSSIGDGESTETIKASSLTFPQYGNHFGNLEIEGTTINAPLFFGDSKNELNKGVGQYNASSYIGCGGTVLIGGHNHTYFKGLKQVEVGDKVIITTNYGTYTYEVTHTAIKGSTDTTAYDLKATEENLVLYTCYPFDTLGLTPQRYFVYGKYVSGPKVLLNE